METSELLAQLFDKKTVALLACLANKKDIIYLRDLAKETGISLATVHRLVQKLKEIGIVNKKQAGKLSYYAVNASSPSFAKLKSMFCGSIDAVTLFKDAIEALGAELYFSGSGKNKKTIVVGAENAQIATIADDIFQKTGEKLAYLATTKDQYAQMKQLGLI